MTKYCLESTIIGFDNIPYVNTSGILTGANNSVSLANAFLAQVTEDQIERQGLLVFRRFIDDIICHFLGKTS